MIKEVNNLYIRLMEKKDKKEVKEMMYVFYHSPAVLSDGSCEIYENDIEACIGNNPFIEGYVFEENHTILGYSMISRSFSTEFGKPCIWIEDIYVKEEHRNKGIGKKFFEFIENKFSGCLFRLEAEQENERAIEFYRKCGFGILPYLELKK